MKGKSARQNTPHVLVKHCSSVGDSKMKRIRKQGKVKSKGMMSPSKCFIVLTVSSRKGANHVLRRPFTKEVTIYKVKVKLIFPLSNDQNATFKPFGV